MHGVRNMACAEGPAKGDYASLVQIAHEGELYVDWHLPQCHQRWASREQAEAQALGCSSVARFTDRRRIFPRQPDAAWQNVRTVHSSEGGHDGTSHAFTPFRSPHA
ncbi:hypothetical protein HDG41_006888 [Paraburkholderia sp. JPY162]|uniref:Uncharacterized protein n=1 Tax=Paraburkholderia youngii TaxID=2782701 RepID=A0A7W8P8Y3_9BURK|nr:hypothetical protein [Paraburkholderia youngii]